MSEENGKKVSRHDWYIEIPDGVGRHEIRGPFTANIIKGSIASGDITENTRIRLGTEGEWHRLQEEPLFAKRIFTPFFRSFIVVALICGVIAGAVYVVDAYVASIKREIYLKIPAAPAFTIEGPTTSAIGKTERYRVVLASTAVPVTIGWDINGTKYQGEVADVHFSEHGKYTIAVSVSPRGYPTSLKTGIARVTVPGPAEQFARVREAPLTDTITPDSIIDLTNAARAKRDMAPLKTNYTLASVADARAKDMMERGYFSPISPTGEQAFKMAMKAGYRYKFLVENLGAGDYYASKDVIGGWLDDKKYKANIMTRDAEDIGVAVVKGKMKGAKTFIVVQLIGTRSPADAAPAAQSASQAGSAAFTPAAQQVRRGPVCNPPPEGLLHDIDQGKADLASLLESAEQMALSLAEDKEALELQKKTAVHPDLLREKIKDVNDKTAGYAEKRRQYNQLVSQAKIKRGNVNAMITKYTRLEQAYNFCLSKATQQ